MAENQNKPASDKPPEPSAKDVAATAAVLVDKLAPLPPALQLRALQAAATMLGIDKSERGRASTTSQQRSSNNTSQQRSGGNR